MTGNEWNPTDYDDDTGFVFEYGESVVDLLDPSPGERVLDIGCGTGHLAADIADAVGSEGQVVGVDNAPEMVRRARESYPAVRFVHADARAFEPADLRGDVGVDGDADAHDRAFDAVFSNAVLHWIPHEDQPAVTERVADVLAPGGRFVAELGGAGNVARVVGAVRAELRERGYDPEHPWYFPTVGEHAAVLEDGGFEVRLARLFDRPTDLDGESGLRNWLDVFGDSMFEPLDDRERGAAVAAVEDRLRDELYDSETTTWTADYRRLRFLAVRQG